MIYFEIFLLVVLTVCALAVVLSNNIFTSVILFTAYSLVMSVLWLIIGAPDLSITETAVGAGITTLLFFVVLRNINGFEGVENED